MNKLSWIGLAIFVFGSTFSFGQKEVPVGSEIEQATVFFQGAQLAHSAKIPILKQGRQTLVFEKLTDFLDPNTIVVKGSGKFTILSVSMRKNYEDKRISNQELKELSNSLEKLKMQDKLLRDEHLILQADKNILNANSSLKGNDRGVVVADLKEAYSFIHARMVEISKRETEIEHQLTELTKNLNKVQQEIDAQRSKPVINYSEIVVETEVDELTPAQFYFSYLTPNASWKPYYDLRSVGINQPVKLEAKAFVNQTTGIEWKNIDLVLSTSDPYQNASEANLNPWYINYNNSPQFNYTQTRNLPNFDYSGQKIRGEVIDAETGESMPFAKVYFNSMYNSPVISDFNGKFEVTVPKGDFYLNASYKGFYPVQNYVNAPYIKFFMTREGLQLENKSVIGEIQHSGYAARTEEYKSEEILEYIEFDDKTNSRLEKKNKTNNAKNIGLNVSQKDLRVEYAIQSKFSLPSDGVDQRVQIASYDLPASYEYHSVPKLDLSVYLVAQVSGWEKLNLLSGESNVYFDGTFIGKSYIDVNSTSDSISVSLGKDAKVQAQRTRISEKSRNKVIGSRQKFDVTWEIKVKNNGGSAIPLKIKDQFPVSTDADIRVKRGDYSNGKLDDNTGIITWETVIQKGQNQSFLFDYSVEYQKGTPLYLE